MIFFLVVGEPPCGSSERSRKDRDGRVAQFLERGSNKFGLCSRLIDPCDVGVGQRTEVWPAAAVNTEIFEVVVVDAVVDNTSLVHDFAHVRVPTRFNEPRFLAGVVLQELQLMVLFEEISQAGLSKTHVRAGMCAGREKLVPVFILLS